MNISKSKKLLSFNTLWLNSTSKGMSLFTVLTSLTKVSSVSIVTSLYIFRKEPMFFSLYEYLNPKKIPNDNITNENISSFLK